ncbi:MAG: cytochrome c [Bacteroidota bacterium]
MRIFGIFLLLGIIWISCTEEKQAKPDQTQSPKTEVKKEEPKEVDPRVAEGESNYKTHCMTCHMKDGYGVPYLNPPLAETEWVNGNKDTLISIVLEGRTGEMEVNGEVYNGVMIPHNHLSDQEIATILTFVRTSFGNKSSPVMEEEVARVRAQI